MAQAEIDLGNIYNLQLVSLTTTLCHLLQNTVYWPLALLQSFFFENFLN